MSTRTILINPKNIAFICYKDNKNIFGVYDYLSDETNFIHLNYDMQHLFRATKEPVFVLTCRKFKKMNIGTRKKPKFVQVHHAVNFAGNQRIQKAKVKCPELFI